MSISHHAPGSAGPLVIEIGTDEAFFDALREDWEELERACCNRSLFMSWQWQRLWWTHYGAGRQLCIFVARDENRLLGVLPMYQDIWRSGPVSLRRLRTIGSGGDTAPDDLDPLLDPGHAQGIAVEFTRALTQASSRWHIVSCPDLNPEALFTRALLTASATAPRTLLRQSTRAIVCDSLPGNWEDYVHDLGAHRRKSLRRKVRKFEGDGGEVIWHRGTQAVDAGFDDLAMLHKMRWAGRSAEYAFSSDQYLSFHRALMHRLDELGALRLMQLRVQGRAIAMRYGYRLGDTFYDLQSGFDPEFADYSPGELCISYCIEHAIGEGCSRFDMLRGDYEHKRAFLKAERTSTDLTLYRGFALSSAVRLRGMLSAMRASWINASWRRGPNGRAPAPGE